MVKATYLRGEPNVHPGHGWVDVRDLAEAHVLSLESEKASGKRIIISAGSHVWQDWSTFFDDFLNTFDTNKHFLLTDNAASVVSLSMQGSLACLPEGYPTRPITRAVYFDTSREKDIFGLTFRSMEETTKDILDSFQSRGW